MKSTIKNIIFKLGLSKVLDKILYCKVFLKNYNNNKTFVQNYPNIKIPSNYFLYETYQLNYLKYFEDGKLAAKEIAEWTSKYLPTETPINIMEWGCGYQEFVGIYKIPFLKILLFMLVILIAK